MLNLKSVNIGMLAAACFCGSNALADFLPNGGQAQPPYESLSQAKQMVQNVAVRVESTIQKGSGGRGEMPTMPTPQPGEGGEFPQTIPSEGSIPSGWPHRGGTFPSENSFVSEREEVAIDQANDTAAEVLENDQIAVYALQSMGRELFELGQLIDQATMNYSNPSFWAYWGQACFKTNKLIVANQGAKISAGLPLQGMISAADFVPNDYELNSVRQTLWCH